MIDEIIDNRKNKDAIKEYDTFYTASRGHSPIFSIPGKNPISKNLKIGPTIFDKRLLVKSPFDRVSDRNDRNGKTPVIGLESPLPDLELVHDPPHSLAASKRNAGECMFPGES